MKRSTSLSALFATLLISTTAGCGPQVMLDDDDDDGSSSGDGSGTSGVSVSATATTPTSATVSASATDPTVTATDPTTPMTSDSSDSWDDDFPPCPDEVYVDVVDIPLSEIAEWVDADGNIVEGGCWGACEAAGVYGDILSCSAVPLDGGLDTGGGGDDGTPPPATTTTASSTSGADTGGDDLDTGNDPDPLMELTCEWMDYCLGGRGHAALQSDGRTEAVDPIARWAAVCAHAEAASVPAFLGLHRELGAHGAPASLQQRALQAAREEVAHARMMRGIAQRGGASVQRPKFGKLDVRDLETIATENAVEGCVRETWAALEAVHQAAHATDRRVRGVMRRIAADETRHAELARDIDAWCRLRLDEAACARVDAARDAAVARLLEDTRAEAPTEVATQLGLPSRGRARALVEGLRTRLWS